MGWMTVVQLLAEAETFLFATMSWLVLGFTQSLIPWIMGIN